MAFTLKLKDGSVMVVCKRVHDKARDEAEANALLAKYKDVPRKKRSKGQSDKAKAKRLALILKGKTNKPEYIAKRGPSLSAMGKGKPDPKSKSHLRAMRKSKKK